MAWIIKISQPNKSDSYVTQDNGMGDNACSSLIENAKIYDEKPEISTMYFGNGKPELVEV